MKTISIFLILLFFSIFIYGKNDKPEVKSNQIEPANWLKILDRSNSDKRLNSSTLNYYQIPNDVDFRGIVVEAVQWKDKEGEKILIQSVTGQYEAKEYSKDSINYTMQDRSELLAYLFLKKSNDTEYTKMWKFSAINNCFGFDWYTGFIPEATTITDLDDDGISEITFPYVLICHSKTDVGEMHIVMYEGRDKYEVSGNTMINCNSSNPDYGIFTKNNNLNYRPVFSDYLKKRWNLHQCERNRF